MSGDPLESEAGPSKKLPKKVRMAYDRSKISDALYAIRHGMSIRAASLTYNIPRGTLQDRIHGRVDEEVRKPGRRAVFNEAEENKLVEWLLELAKCGFPRKKWDLIMSVKRIIKDENRPNPFQDDTPGQKWYDLFMKRHPEVSQRTPEGINTARAKGTKEHIRQWFADLIKFLTETNNLDILADPTRILNGDETAFSICPKSGKVIGPKGWKNIYEIKRGNEKETITVMTVITAAGENAKPIVVFPYIRRPPLDVVNSAPSMWMLGISESGWMRGDIFYEYITNGVNTWLEEAKIKKPVILFLDGHKSHMSYELSMFCDKNQIILYALPPNTTHILHPADVSIFRPLKSEWRKTVKDWQDEEAKPLTKTTFCPLLKKVLDKDLTKSIKDGFKRCGLYPLDPNAVDYTKCVSNTLETMQLLENSPILTGKDMETTVKVLTHHSSLLKEKGIDADVVKNVIVGTFQPFACTKSVYTDIQKFDTEEEILQNRERLEVKKTDNDLDIIVAENTLDMEEPDCDKKVTIILSDYAITTENKNTETETHRSELLSETGHLIKNTTRIKEVLCTHQPKNDLNKMRTIPEKLRKIEGNGYDNIVVETDVLTTITFEGSKIEMK